MARPGKVFWRDEQGVLWVSESFSDEFGVVTTQFTEVQE